LTNSPAQNAISDAATMRGVAHPRQHALHAAHHLGHAALADHLHHLLRLFELLQQRLTSCTCTPAPIAIRRLREALISSGLRRSGGVIELMMPSMRRIWIFADFCQFAGSHLAGARQLVHQRAHAAHLLHLLHLRLEVFQIEALAALDLLGIFAALRP
jgi:hypothetical protein